MQVGIQRADRVIRDHIQRARHRKRRDRRAAGQRLELNHAERIGQAREYEHVGRRQMRGQVGALFFAQEFDVRIFLREFAPLSAKTVPVISMKKSSSMRSFSQRITSGAV